ALFLALHGVDNRLTGLQHARVDAHEGQGTDERVGSDLERQSGERRIVVGVTLVFRSLVAIVDVIRMDTLERRDLGRRRQEADEGIENQGHALVLERGTTDSRNDFTGDGALTQTGLDVLEGEAG